MDAPMYSPKLAAETLGVPLKTLQGTLKKDGVAEEMRKTDRDTLIGRVQFGANGDNLNFTHHMGQHQGDKVAIVWPKAAATNKMNYPAVPW